MRLTRSAFLFGSGLIGIAAETVYSLRFHETPDPTLLLIFGAMLGLPIFLNQDLRGNNERRSRDTREDGDDLGPSPTPRSDNSPTKR